MWYLREWGGMPELYLLWLKFRVHEQDSVVEMSETFSIECCWLSGFWSGSLYYPRSCTNLGCICEEIDGVLGIIISGVQNQSIFRPYFHLFEGFLMDGSPFNISCEMRSESGAVIVARGGRNWAW
jgi:hypothetical protein